MFEGWARVKDRLRGEIGEQIYGAWFPRLELESIEDDAVRMSVPTKFLKNWISAHYAGRLLRCWQHEKPDVCRIDLSVRTMLYLSERQTPISVEVAPPAPENSESSESSPQASENPQSEESPRDRSLKRALDRLLNYMRLGQMTMEQAEQELSVLWSQHGSPPSIKGIQLAVCRHFGIQLIDILSARRTADVVMPRQIAMYLAKTLTLKSYPEIGRRFAGRDHTTVLHAVRKIEALKAYDTGLAQKIEDIKTEILGQQGELTHAA